MFHTRTGRIGSRRENSGDRKMISRRWQMITPLLGALWMAPSLANWTDARCDIYPKGSDHTDKMIPCTFG